MFKQSITQSANKIIGEFGLPLIGTSAIPATLGLLLVGETYLLEKKQIKDNSLDHLHQMVVLLAHYLELHALQVTIDKDGITSYSVISFNSPLFKQTPETEISPWAELGPLRSIGGSVIGSVIGGVVAAGSGIEAGAIDSSDIIKEEEPTKEPGTTLQNVVVENKQGTVIYQIQNLHIHLTSEFVNQLIINPKEVINNFKDQLRNEISRATAQPK